MNHSEAGKLGYKKVSAKLLKRVEEQKKAARARWQGKTCPECNKSIAYKQRRNKYCSHSCAAATSNRKRHGHGAPRLRRICERCGEPLRKGRRFCSRRCSRAAAKEAQYERYDLLSSFEGERDGTVRRYLIMKLGLRCQICGITDWQGQPTPVIMDHIDGNSTNCSRDNIRLICPNCDALLPTYTGRNRGNGRHARRERYRQGKSY
jgi:predicted nucleic acid-binding Zn ribbon protein